MASAAPQDVKRCTTGDATLSKDLKKRAGGVADQTKDRLRTFAVLTVLTVL
eukprot:CAMPEP_0197926228 /NCGR_PEP_ID=MMETSP1439-20131203/98801_1 /TAXON_ID=66791 /ORGANISM="Gonyaulax spinifera, Strain CCMP409" /LENGTH=50 /DNA_ID=CAMNT_0043548753 /DNA_START=99 /DNA_END=248 /DNA_ORIENTATION=-